MKVFELEGAALDLWVARAAELNGARIQEGVCRVEAPACDGGEPAIVEFTPSTDWEVAGRIIESIKINVMYELDSAADRSSGWWIAFVQPLEESTFGGVTPLIAAMRAAVHWKYGTDVPNS